MNLLFYLAILVSISANTSAKPFIIKVSHDPNRWEEVEKWCGSSVKWRLRVKCDGDEQPPFLPFDVKELTFRLWDYRTNFDSFQGDLGDLKHLEKIEWQGPHWRKFIPIHGHHSLKSISYHGLHLDDPTVNEGTFADLDNLEDFSIERSNVETMEKDAFVNIGCDNGKHGIHLFTLKTTALAKLKAESFRNVKVSNMILENNKIASIQKDFFEGFSHLGSMIILDNRDVIRMITNNRDVIWNNFVFDPKPPELNQLILGDNISWSFISDGFCGEVEKSGCKCVEEKNIIDCTMKPPGFNPLKFTAPHAPHPKRINFVRHDITDLLTGGKTFSDDTTKSKEILEWCQKSFPDDENLLQFRKGEKVDLIMNRMTLDIGDLDRFIGKNTQSIDVNTYLLTSAVDNAVIPKGRFIELGVLKTAIKGKVYDDVPLYMFDDVDHDIRCETTTSEGICKASLRFLKIESECSIICPSISSSARQSHDSTYFRRSFLQQLMFCGKKSNAEKKNIVLEREMLEWVERVASGEGNGMNDLAAAAGSMKTTLKNSGANSLHPVPYLSGAVWQRITESIKNRLKGAVDSQADLQSELKEVEQRLFDRGANVKERQLALNTLVSKSKRALDSSRDVIEVRKSDFEDAQSEVAKSSSAQKKLYKRFQRAKSALDRATRGFKAGCIKFRNEAIAEAAMGIVSSIFGIFAGKLNFDDATKSVEKINQILTIFREVQTIAKTLWDLSQNIATVIQFLNDVKSIPKEIPINKAEYDSYKSKMQLVDKVSDLSVSIVEWKNLHNFADAVFGAGKVVEIDGSSTLRRAIADIGNWGEALTQEAIAQANVVKEMKSMSRKRQLAEKEKERMDEELKEIESRVNIHASTDEDFKAQLNGEIAFSMQVIYRTRLQEMHLQLLLFDALDQYCNTYFYSKFEECPKGYKPTLSLTSHELMDHINVVYETGWKTLSKFDPAPAPVDNLKVFIEDNPQVCGGNSWNYQKCPIRSIKETNALKIAFHPRNSKFRSFDRFRVNRMQVYLEGAVTSTRDDPIYVKMGTSGVFNDTYKGDVFQFVSVPLNLAFIYEPNNDDQIILDGSINDDKLYYQTTPFTDWIISLPEEANSNLQIQNLKTIKVVFSGSALPKYFFWKHG